MDHCKAPTLHLMLQVHHEQRSSLGHDVVHIAFISERIRESRRGKTVHAVDGDLKGSGQSLGAPLVGEVFGQLAVQHPGGSFVIAMLNGYTRLLDLTEPPGEHGTKQLLILNGRWVHARNVDNGHVRKYPCGRKHIAAFANFLIPVHTLAKAVGVTGKQRTSLGVKLRVLRVQPKLLDNVVIDRRSIRQITHEPIVEFALRIALLAKYNSCGQSVGRVVHRQTGYISKDLPCSKVGLRGIPYGLGSQYVVVTVFRNLRPQLFRNRLIPAKAKFLVAERKLIVRIEPKSDKIGLNAELISNLFNGHSVSKRLSDHVHAIIVLSQKLNLPLLQTLLGLSIVIDVCVGNIIGLGIERFLCSLHDDPLRKVVQFSVALAKIPGIQHVVVVLAAVEAHQPVLEQLFNLGRFRIDHPVHRIPFALELPVDQKQVRKYLAVKESDGNII